MMGRSVTSQLLLASLAATAWAAGNSTNPNTNTTSSASNTTNVDSSSLYYGRRAYHSMAVLNGFVYIEGGEIASGDGKSSVAAEKTVALSLHDYWARDNITYREVNNHRPPPANNAVMWTVPSDMSQNNALYRFGGSVPKGGKADDSNRRLWVFLQDDNGGGSWGIETSQDLGASVLDTFSFSSNALGAYCQSEGLVIGGSGTPGTDTIFTGDQRVFTPGVLSYTRSGRTWVNTSSTPSADRATGSNQDWSAAARDGGQAICASYAPAPLTLVLGGYEKGQAATSVPALADMGQIKIYNFVNQTWLRQKASGDVPPKRSAFCAVSAWSGFYNNSTQDIYVYGGRGENGDALSDMYVLTLPAYRWFKLNVTSPARMYHACAKASSSDVFFASGGFDDKQQAWTKDEAWPRGLGVFNMSSLAWQTEFGNQSYHQYNPPEAVKSWYRKGIPTDWDDSNARYLSGYYGNSDGSGSSFEGPFSPLSDPEKAGVLAGSVILGVIIMGTAYWIWRKRFSKRYRRDLEKAELSSSSSESELSADSERQELPVGERPELGGVARSELPNSARSELPAYDSLSCRTCTCDEKRDEEEEESGDIADEKITPPTSPSDQTESYGTLSVVSPCTPTVASQGSISPRSETGQGKKTGDAKSIYELE